MLEVRRENGLKVVWKDADEVFAWWMEDKNIPGQINLDQFLKMGDWSFPEGVNNEKDS